MKKRVKKLRLAPGKFQVPPSAPPTLIEALIRRVELFCAYKEMSVTRFGRNACKNASAVARLRKGIYSAKAVSKIEAYLEENR